MQKTAFIFGLILLIASFILWHFVLPIPTGYAAKNLCSGIFVAGMEENFIRTNDLNFSLVSLTSNEVDYEKKTVRSTFLGLKPHVAIFRNNSCGCTLLGNKGNYTQFPEVRRSHALRQDTLYWPYGNIEHTTSNSKLSSEIANVLDDEFSQDVTGTRAIIVVHDGIIVGERYAESFDKNKLLLGWSMNKSVIATLIGILVQKELVNISDPVPIQEWSQGGKGNITWRHLLQMSSGLEWDENYFWISDVTKMLYTEGDTYGYAIKSFVENEPGNSWEYSSGTTNILSGLMREILADDAVYHNFPYAELFEKIGANSFVMELDAAGNFVGSSYAYATARDWAKFGMLYLNEGNWNGHQLLPEGWDRIVSSPALNSDGQYGAQFWLNRSGVLENVPRGAYFADGFHGQRVFIVPSKNLVVVRLGLSTDEVPDFNHLLSQIIAAVDTYGVEQKDQ